MIGRPVIGRLAMPRVLAAAALLGAILAGCSDGIEINSKLFDAVGLTGSTAHKEPQLAERAGLVIPPPMAELPEPGSGQKVMAAVDAQLPQGPEALAQQAEAASKKQKAEACAKARRAHDDVAEASNCSGLLGSLVAGTLGSGTGQ